MLIEFEQKRAKIQREQSYGRRLEPKPDNPLEDTKTTKDIKKPVLARKPSAKAKTGRNQQQEGLSPQPEN